MKHTTSSFITDRKRASGLGSAKTGTKHFLHERISGVALIPLTFLLVATLIALSGADHATAVAKLKQPLFGLTLLAFIAAGVYHMKLGMEVIIEDYVPNEGAKLVLMMLNTFFSALIGLAGVYALIRITLGS